MSMLRSIYCSVRGCTHKYEEAKPGAGFPAWGSVQGRTDTETGETDFHLCPEHLDEVFKFLTKRKG